MPRRHRRLPRLWLMTDERLGERLADAVARLPRRRAGIVFRHYALPEGERRALFERVKRIARRRGLLLLLAGPAAEAARWGADGSHGAGAGAGLRTAPAHDRAELRAAARAGAAAAFVSPVFPTRSHPKAAAIGPIRFMRLARLARRARLPVIALGGIDARRARRLRGAWGWAGIDAWTR